MKTVYAPDTFNAFADAARAAIGPEIFPAVVVLAAIAGAAIFATVAARFL